MLYSISGKIIAKESGLLVVCVGGLGIGVWVSRPEKYIIEDTVTLHTVMHWNQETGPQLFGFDALFDKQLFILLISCSGVGPKLALTLLHAISAGQCIQAIAQGDIAQLSSIKGIGPKKAELLILNLKQKVGALASHLGVEVTENSGFTTAFRDVADALHSLRYTAAEISMVLGILQQDSSLHGAAFDQLMRRALSLLARQSR